MIGGLIAMTLDRSILRQLGSGKRTVVVTGTKAAVRYENDPQHPWRPGQVSLLTEQAETRPLNLQTGIDDVVMAWLAAIRGEAENPTPPAAGVRVAELTQAILEAGRASHAERAGAAAS